MEVDLRAGFVRFYCQVNLEKHNRLALLTWFACKRVVSGLYTSCLRYTAIHAAGWVMLLKAPQPNGVTVRRASKH
jgi:hypothetical protein